MDKKKLALISAGLLLIGISSAACGKKAANDDAGNKSESEIISEIYEDKSKIEISDVSENKDGSAAAEITVTIPDFEKIHSALEKQSFNASSSGKNNFLKEMQSYIDDDAFQTTIVVNSEVKKVDGKWIPASDTLVNDLLRQQFQAILIEELSKTGEIEIGH